MTYENLAATFESIGEERGFTKGKLEGIAEGKELGKIENLVELIRDGVITLDYVRTSGKVTIEELARIEEFFRED